MSISLGKEIVSFGDYRILLEILQIFFIIPTTNAGLMIEYLNRIIQIAQFDESLFSLILMQFIMIFRILLIIQSNFLDLVLFKLVVQLLNEICFFIH